MNKKIEKRNILNNKKEKDVINNINKNQKEKEKNLNLNQNQNQQTKNRIHFYEEIKTNLNKIPNIIKEENENNSNTNNINNNNDELNIRRIKSAKYPKVDKLFKNYETLDVKAYSIKLQVADADLLDLFDRSQRTKSATLAKVGDYEYYTPCQRIGSFMDFSQTLRWRDLKNIEKHYYHTKNQLGFLQSKHNIVNLVEQNFLKNSSKYFSNPNSLFHGFLKDEYKLDKYYKDIQDKNKTYDPFEFLPKAFMSHLHDIEFWPENFKKIVQTSINNYTKYFTSDKITIDDLEPFVEDIKKNILIKIDFNLLEKKQKFIKNVFEEIKNEYYFTIKRVIMMYILRSPYERKRLNIQFFPKATQPSSFTIANHGSFNRNYYINWVRNYSLATEFIEKNLFVYDVISTSILEWTESFKHVKLVLIKDLENLFSIGSGYKKNMSTMHLLNFNEIQICFSQKVFYFLKDVYYRGIILILKKNKIFKNLNNEQGKWTFKGFIKKPVEKKKKNFNENLNGNENINTNQENNLEENAKLNENNNNITKNFINKLKKQNNISTNKKYLEKILDYDKENAFMGIFDKIEEFWIDMKIDDFPDVRVNNSYFIFLKNMSKKMFDISSYIYDGYDWESKLKLNNSISVFVNMFFRNLIEISVRELVNFILSFPLIDDILLKLNSEFFQNNPNYEISNINPRNFKDILTNGIRLANNNNSEKRNSKYTLKEISFFSNDLDTIQEYDNINSDHLSSVKNLINLKNQNLTNLNSKEYLREKEKETSKEETKKTNETHNKTKEFQSNPNNYMLLPHYEINDYIRYSHTDIKLPKIKSFVVLDLLSPILNIKTKIDTIYNVVKLEFSYDQISDMFLKICNSTINLFNGMYSTHFLDFKRNLPNDLEKSKQEHLLRISEIFSDKLDTSYKNYYNNISPNVTIEDYNSSEDKEKNKELYEFFSSNTNSFFLTPANINEEIFLNFRNAISKTVKDHYLEMEECLKLFEPVKELINHSFIDCVNNYVENYSKIPDYQKFTYLIERIKIFQRYLVTIPDFVSN